MSDKKLIVEVPCSIGDMVWGLKRTRSGLIPHAGFVSQIYFLKDMRLQIVVKYICRGQWGKNIFATEEEAIAEIERRKREKEGGSDGKIH